MLPRCMQMVEVLHVDVIVYDYEGYGFSDGCHTEDALFRDIEAVFAYALGCYYPDSIFLYGESSTLFSHSLCVVGSVGVCHVAAKISQMQRQLQRQLQRQSHSKLHSKSHSKSHSKTRRQRAPTAMEEVEGGIELDPTPSCASAQRQVMRAYHIAHFHGNAEGDTSPAPTESSLSVISNSDSTTASGPPTLHRTDLLGFSFFTSEHINPALVSAHEIAALFVEEGRKRFRQGGFQIGGVILHSALLSGARAVFSCNPLLCIDRFDNSHNAKKITVGMKRGTHP